MIDAATVRVQAGAGGDGVVSFRREKFVPRGGPDGGDGGNGGSVVFRAAPEVHGLGAFRRRRVLRAERGRNGDGGRRHGHRGADLVVPVPVGTQVFLADDEASPFADLDEPGVAVVVARGGIGGRGNARFATPTNQAPRIAQRGEPGEEREFRLELKLLADVGIVGAPNAGKSTLLSAISAARPKIAPYPFTTLEPELGVVEVGYDTFVAADLPGLIEGASAGVGLGHEFLRHIERTRLLIHVLAADEPDPLKTFDLINGEVIAFDPALGEKPQIVALNKLDLPDAAARAVEMRSELERRGFEVHAISAATGQGIDPLVRRALQRLAEMRREETRAAEAAAAMPVIRPEPSKARFTVTRRDSTFVVEGRKPVLLVETMDMENPEARAVVMARLTRMGVVGALRRAGAQPGDRVRFGSTDVRWDA